MTAQDLSPLLEKFEHDVLNQSALPARLPAYMRPWYVESVRLIIAHNRTFTEEGLRETIEDPELSFTVKPKTVRRAWSFFVDWVLMLDPEVELPRVPPGRPGRKKRLDSFPESVVKAISVIVRATGSCRHAALLQWRDIEEKRSSSGSILYAFNHQPVPRGFKGEEALEIKEAIDVLQTWARLAQSYGSRGKNRQLQQKLAWVIPAWPTSQSPMKEMAMARLLAANGLAQPKGRRKKEDRPWSPPEADQ